MILTYKYRIKDRSARKTLRHHAYAVNQVWNYCCAQQRDVESRYRAGAPRRKWATHYDLTYLTKGTSKELGIDSRTIGEVCRIFASSRDRAKHAPSFRASGGSRRALGWVPFRYQSDRVDGNSIAYVGKRYRFWMGGRPMPQGNTRGAFVEDAIGRWYVCFTVKVAENVCVSASKVGIDLGLNTIACCSDGRAILAPRIYRRQELALSVAQRAGNNRRVKAIHAKIKNCRADFLHKATTAIAHSHALIAVGNVNSSRLAKTRMAKSVLDAGWSMFRSQLRYKASRHGAVYLDVDERFTTRTCSACGSIPASSPKGMGTLGIREWECSACGASHDRDVNAARNILALALSAQRHVDESRRAALVVAPSDKHETSTA